MDTSKKVTHVSLCSGYGGIDLGLKRAIPHLCTVALCEVEAFACANLVAKMEAGVLDAAPIWTNLKTFPWGKFHGKVDILSGGYPCQPFSAAGKRLGADDPRHLWPFIADGIARMRPRACFFENVEGHITLGLRNVLHDLGGMGYRTTWGVFSASEVGAPHQRKRVFIMAHRCESGLERLTGHGDGSRQSRWLTSLEDGSVGSGSVCLWPSRPGQPKHAWEPPRTVANSRDDAGERRDAVGPVPCGHDGSQGKGEGSGGSGPDEAGQRTFSEPVRGGAESAVGDTDCRGQPPSILTGGRSEAAGGGQGDIEQAEPRQAEPPLGRDADGPAHRLDYAELCFTSDNRTDELRLLGNGVVPATAERAFLVLANRLPT